MKILTIGKNKNPWITAILRDWPETSHGRIVILTTLCAQIFATLPAVIARRRVIWIGDDKDIGFVAKLFLKIMSSWVHTIIAPNQFSEIIYLRLGIPSPKIRVIYPPCELKLKKQTRSEIFTLVCDASIGFESGLSTLLCALNLAREILGNNIKLIIGGQIKNRSHLEWSVRQLGLNNLVQFTPGANSLWMQSGSVYIMPNKIDMLAPISLAQAMSCGLIVVATDMPGNREFVEAGKNALVVKAEDAEAMSQAIIRLARNKELRERLGRENYDFAQTHFSSEVFAQKINSILNPK